MPSRQEKHRKKLIAEGKCGKCGQPRNQYPELCDECEAKKVEREAARQNKLGYKDQKAYRERMLAEGRCEICGEPQSPTSSRHCPKHQAQVNERVRRYKEKKRREAEAKRKAARAANPVVLDPPPKRS